MQVKFAKVDGWGGRRKGAGRPNKSGLQAHVAREKVDGSQRAFKERYHLHVLKTPTEVKNALLYVLLNHSKHRKFISYMDEFSSAQYFSDWKLLLRGQYQPVLEQELDQFTPLASDFLKPAESWLGKVGWRRARVAA